MFVLKVNQCRTNKKWLFYYHKPAFQNIFTKVEDFSTDVGPILHAEFKNRVHFPGLHIVYLYSSVFFQNIAIIQAFMVFIFEKPGRG